MAMKLKFYIDNLIYFLNVPLLPSIIVNKCNETLKRTTIIDSGEKDFDENREFWDLLVNDKFYRNFRDFL